MPEAAHSLRKALEFAESAEVPSNDLVAEILGGLAAVQQSQGDYAAAAVSLNRARMLQSGGADTNPRTTMLLLNNLGAMYRRTGRYPEAEQALRESLAVGAALTTPSEFGQVIVLGNLA
jgi:Flp pilus assembly protein TadD